MKTRLREYRVLSGFTQDEVAKRAQISVRAYKNYEAGTRVPDATTAILLAKALNSTVEALFAQKTYPKA